MQQNLQPIVKDLVLIGGGHSHAIVMRMFGMKPLPGVRLTLITAASETAYSGMLPGHIAGFYSHDECHIDLRPLANFAQAQLYIDTVVALDLENNKVLCTNGLAVDFDVLSIDIGSTPSTISVSGATEYAIAAKPVSQLLQHWHELIETVGKNPQEPISIAIAGGGAGGVELALSMRSRLHRILHQTQQPIQNLEIHLFQRSMELMPNYHQSVRHQIQQILTEQGIKLHLGESVCKIAPKNLTSKPSLQAEREIEADFLQNLENLSPCRREALNSLVGKLDRGLGFASSFPHDLNCQGNKEVFEIKCESGLTIECNKIFWVTQASAPEWLKTAGLGTDKQGFILVEDTLQSQTHPQVFAAGDIATMVNHPRPKAGVFAVRQGKPLFENLQRILLGKSLKPYRPQKQYLSLIGIGDERAIATRGVITLPPHKLLWRWKNWIDRRFMERFCFEEIRK